MAQVIAEVSRWQQTPIGQWCNENSTRITWVCHPDQGDYHIKVEVVVDLDDEHLSIWTLTNGNPV